MNAFTEDSVRLPQFHAHFDSLYMDVGSEHISLVFI